MKRVISLWLCFVLVASSAVVLGEEEAELIEGKVVVRNGVMYTSHAPMRIDSNAQFASMATAEGWPGNGSASNPWIIENYIINASGSSLCIFIGNITSHFVVRNCYLFNARTNDYYINLGSGLGLFDCTNATIFNNTAENNWYGITVSSCPGITISDNYVINNTRIGYTTWGIGIFYSSDCTIKNNIALNHNVSNSNGIHCWDLSESAVINNTCYQNYNGLSVQFSENNYIHDNVLYSNNHVGFHVSNSQENAFYNNTVRANGYTSFYIYSSSNNTFFHNNILETVYHYAQDAGDYLNKWDNGYPSGGNYWQKFIVSDYRSGINQNILGKDGIGDKPFTTFTQGSNIDRYPLYHQFSCGVEVPPNISVVTPVNVTVIKSGTVIQLDIWDGNYNLSNANFSFDGLPPQSFSVNYNVSTTGWSEGDHTLLIQASDQTNLASQKLLCYSIDNTAPTISA
ncbi:MAG: right-handed parallel beta-helix repeat-containing protein, partial [Thermoplasmata archaeon]|nr:right-handed parallel beta-helix repeat-containing protein [Thermoplasmata archaeon]